MFTWILLTGLNKLIELSVLRDHKELEEIRDIPDHRD